MDTIEAERLPDGRLRVTLNETAEATLLAVAGLACDIVTAPREDPFARVDEKLARLQDRTETVMALAEGTILPLPLRSERMATAAEIGEAVRHCAAERLPTPWVRLGAGHFVQVTGVSSRPGNPRAFIHFRAPNGDELARDVAAADQFALVTDAEMAEAEGRAA